MLYVGSRTDASLFMTSSTFGTIYIVVIHICNKPAWQRGRTLVLRSLGTMFGSPRGRRNFFLFASSEQLSVALAMHLARWSYRAILNSLAPLGAGVSVIAPLPERLPGLIEGSSRPQSSFEYVCLVVNSLSSSPLGG